MPILHPLAYPVAPIFTCWFRFNINPLTAAYSPRTNTAFSLSGPRMLPKLHAVHLKGICKSTCPIFVLFRTTNALCFLAAEGFARLCFRGGQKMPPQGESPFTNQVDTLSYLPAISTPIAILAEYNDRSSVCWPASAGCGGWGLA